MSHLKCKNNEIKILLFNEYKTLKSQSNELIRLGRKNHYANYFNENNNLRKIWEGIKELVHIKPKNREPGRYGGSLVKFNFSLNVIIIFLYISSSQNGLNNLSIPCGCLFMVDNVRGGISKCIGKTKENKGVQTFKTAEN